jgi:uncharacterized protein (TIGR02453 family)
MVVGVSRDIRIEFTDQPKRWSPEGNLSGCGPMPSCIALSNERTTFTFAQEVRHMDRSQFPEFSGIPAEGIAFLKELAGNNNRGWFEANRQRYESDVRRPALSLVATLGKRLAAAYPPTTYSTSGNGGSLMRINRDVRFSADKRPYKTQIAMMFVPEGRSKMGAPGFGVQITTEKVELVAGQFAFDPVQLEAYRRAVLDGAAGPALEAAAARVSEAGDYPVEGRQLKRVPRGFDADHPRAEWLLYKGLHVFAPAISLAVSATPDLVDAVMGHFEKMAPIWWWLMRHVEGDPRAGG